MNQAVKEALAIIVRQLLIALGTSVGLTGVITPFLGEATNAIVGALIVAGAVGWAQIVQLFKRQKLVQSLQVAELSEKSVEAMVKSPTTATPSVMTPKTEVPT